MPSLFFNLPKTPSFTESVKIFPDTYNSPRDFWHLAKNISNNFTSSSFPPLVQPDGTNAISSISKAELFTQTFVNNSTLDDSGLVPPSPSPSDYFMLPFKILRNDVFHALAGLNPRKAYGPDGVPPIVLRNCASMLAPCLVKLFQLYLLLLPFPLAGSLPTFSLFLKRVTVLILETTVLLL